MAYSYQQGDVIIRKIDKLTKVSKDWNGNSRNLSDKNERWIQKDRVVIAEGVVTGHAHAFNTDSNKDVEITLW